MDKNKHDKSKLYTMFVILLNLSYIFVVIGISTYFANKWIIYGIALFIYSMIWLMGLDESPDSNKM